MFLLLSCDISPEKSGRMKGESIYRLAHESYFELETPTFKPLPSYSWQERYEGKYPKITKEFFRCRGGTSHPIKGIQEKTGTRYIQDCGGYASHSLPLKEEKEFIYPCLIEILNYLQDTTGQRIKITSGHTCPKHCAYCDPTPANWGSKHMIGAEVDFYIEGLEESPEKVIDLIMAYYRERFKDKKEYEEFIRFEGSKISTLPWYNREIFIKLLKPEEGRDFDNQHPYSYICLQVRTNRENGEKVTYDKNAAQNFRRY